MSSVGRAGVGAVIARFARRLRHPTLFWLMAGVFVLDLLIPDAIPFADEILLGLGTVFLGSLRSGDSEEEEEA